jgi:hypothetical protein
METATNFNDLRGQVHREVHRNDAVIIDGAEYLRKTHGLTDAEHTIRRLRTWIDTEGRNCPSNTTVDAILNDT